MKNTVSPKLFDCCGKTNATLDWLAECLLAPEGKHTATPRNGDIVYVITREEVEAGDTSRIISDFSPDSTKKTLRRLCGRVHFTVAGYDEDPSEIYELTAVRDYFALVQRQWPCWSFACSLRSPCLRAVALSISPNVLVVREGDNLTAQIRACDVATFFNESVSASLALYRLAGHTRAQTCARMRGVARYLEIA